MTDGSGRNFIDSLMHYDRATSSWKTSQACLPLMEDQPFAVSLPTLPPAGSMRNGTVFQHPPLVPRTSGTGSFSSPTSTGHQAPLPTPTATVYGSSGNGTGNNTQSRGRPSLETFAKQWPTPKSSSRGPDYARGNRPRSGGDDLATAAARWPTPPPSDASGGGNRTSTPSKAHAGVSLTDACLTGDSSTPRSVVTGQLNPQWVEWLMGFPTGWPV